MILHLIKNFHAIIALFLSPCGQSWWLEERLSVPPLSGREDRYRWILPTTNAQEIAPFVQRPACLHITLESPLPFQNIKLHHHVHIGLIGLLQHHLGFLPYATLYVLNTLGWLKYFFLVACQYDREDEELLNANLASWIHLPAGTDAGKLERWGAHDRT